MSKQLEMLKDLGLCIQSKNKNHKILEPVYHRQSDIYTTLHVHSITSLLASGKTFTVAIHTHYQKFDKTLYELNIMISSKGINNLHRVYRIEKNQINIESIKQLLKEKHNMTF